MSGYDQRVLYPDLRKKTSFNNIEGLDEGKLNFLAPYLKPSKELR